MLYDKEAVFWFAFSICKFVSVIHVADDFVRRTKKGCISRGPFTIFSKVDKSFSIDIIDGRLEGSTIKTEIVDKVVPPLLSY